MFDVISIQPQCYSGEEGRCCEDACLLSKVLLIINESFCHLSSKHAKNSFSLSVNTLKL